MVEKGIKNIGEDIGKREREIYSDYLGVTTDISVSPCVCVCAHVSVCACCRVTVCMRVRQCACVLVFTRVHPSAYPYQPHYHPNN